MWSIWYSALEHKESSPQVLLQDESDSVLLCSWWSDAAVLLMEGWLCRCCALNGRSFCAFDTVLLVTPYPLCACQCCLLMASVRLLCAAEAVLFPLGPVLCCLLQEMSQTTVIVLFPVMT